MRGPKYFQLEGHPNLFSHIHGAYQASRAHSVLCTKRGEWVVAAIWEWLCVFLIVSCLFTPALLSLAAMLGLRWLGSLGLFQVLSPSCNLSPGMLNNSHSCTGVYISTCCSPHQWQNCAHRYGIKVVFHQKNFLFRFSSTYPNFTFILAVILQMIAHSIWCKNLIKKKLLQTPQHNVYGGDRKKLSLTTRVHAGVDASLLCLWYSWWLEDLFLHTT